MLAGRRDRVAIAKRLQEKLDSLEVEEAERFYEFNALVVELTGNQTLVLLTVMLEHIARPPPSASSAPSSTPTAGPAGAEGGTVRGSG